MIKVSIVSMRNENADDGWLHDMNFKWLLDDGFDRAGVGCG